MPVACVWLLASSGARAQSSDGLGSGGLGSDGLNHDRIMGVVPNYQTVNDATAATPPLTRKQKWLFFLEETRDPFNIAAEALSAGLPKQTIRPPSMEKGARLMPSDSARQWATPLPRICLATPRSPACSIRIPGISAKVPNH